MLCPYCGKEMKAGFVQAASNIIFSEKKHLMRMQPANDQEVLLAEHVSRCCICMLLHRLSSNCYTWCRKNMMQKIMSHDASYGRSVNDVIL